MKFDEKGYDANKQAALERAKSRIVNEYETEQAAIYKMANPKYKGKKDLHTFRDQKVSNALAMLDKKGFISALNLIIIILYSRSALPGTGK